MTGRLTPLSCYPPPAGHPLALWLLSGFPRARLVVPGLSAGASFCSRSPSAFLENVLSQAAEKNPGLDISKIDPSILEQFSSMQVRLVCVCARARAYCVCEREREREREGGWEDARRIAFRTACQRAFDADGGHSAPRGSSEPRSEKGGVLESCLVGPVGTRNSQSGSRDPLSFRLVLLTTLLQA